MSSAQQFYGTGRRKTASARVFIRPDSKAERTTVTINRNSLAKYIPGEIAYLTVYEPLNLLKIEQPLAIHITVKGGGKSAQSQAIRHGLSKALVAWENANAPSASAIDQEEPSTKSALSFRATLKKAGLLRGDDRQVERKKPGLDKARKRAQYSKR